MKVLSVVKSTVYEILAFLCDGFWERLDRSGELSSYVLDKDIFLLSGTHVFVS
jgi:hypothetical protein